MRCVINPPAHLLLRPPCTRVDESTEELKCVLRVRDVFKKNDAAENHVEGLWWMGVFVCFWCNYSIQVSANTTEFIIGILQNRLFPQRGLKAKKSFQAHRHHPKHPAAWPLFFVLGFVTASPVMACNSRLLLGVSTFLCLYSVCFCECVCVCEPYLHDQSPVT